MITNAFHAPTGCGIRRILVASSTSAKKWPGGIMVLSHRRELCLQWRNILPEAETMLLNEWRLRADEFENALIIVDNVPDFVMSRYAATLHSSPAEVWLVQMPLPSIATGARIVEMRLPAPHAAKALNSPATISPRAAS